MLSLERSKRCGVVDVPDDSCFVATPCDEVFVRCQRDRRDVVTMSRVRHDSFPALQIPFDGNLISSTCVEKRSGGVDTDAIYIIRMSLERMQNAPVVKIPQYRSFVPTSSTDDTVSARSHSNSNYPISMPPFERSHDVSAGYFPQNKSLVE